MARHGTTATHAHNDVQIVMLDRHTPHRPASTEPFDRLTRLAAHLFDVPMAALVYADAGPATVVASTGFEAASSSCNDGLFLHAADQNAITVVNDVVCHPGFADSPLVTEAPCVRFYAGAPLRQEDGRVIGALCVMDVAPSSTPPGAGERLGDLAALAAREVKATRPRLLRPPAESEREFRDLLHALDDVAAWTIDFAPDRSLDALLDVPLAASLHRVRYANDAVEAVYGYPREDFVQRPSLWVESVDAVEQAHTARVRAALFETGAADYVCRIERPDGETRWLHHRVRLLHDEQGRPTGIGGIATDITRRRTTERELLETTSRLETMVRNLHGGLLFESEEREVMYVNDRFCTLFDIEAPPDALVGTDCEANAKSAAALMQDPDAFLARVEALLAVREPARADIIERADGRIYERDFIPVFSGETYKGHLWDYRDVTERQRLDRRLRESARELASEQAFIEQVLDTLTDVFAVITPEGRLVRWNERLLQVTGYTAEELSTLTTSDLFSAAAHTSLAQALDAVVHDEEARRTIELQTKSGMRIPYEFTGAQLDTRGEAPLLCVTGRDITERQAAEEALQQERDLLDNIMNTSVAAIAVADTAANIIFANARAKSVLRLSAHPGGGLPYAPPAFHLATPDGTPLPRNEQPIPRVTATGAPILDEHCVALWPDGTQRHLSMNVAPLTDEAGRVVRVVLSVDDITQRIQAERQLAQSERKYHRLFDASHDAIFLHTPAGTILEANDRAAELFGASTEELVGTSVEALHPPSAHNAARSALRTLREEEGTVRFRIRCQRHDASTFWGDVSASSFQIDGTPVVQGIIRDITTQKEAEERTQRALDKERELGRLKSRFVSMASHELRTPLTTIQSSSELTELYVRRGDVEEAARYLTRIRKTVGSMTELLEDVLHFGRAESGRLPFNPSTLEIRAIARELLQEVQRGVGSGHVFDVRGLDQAGLVHADDQLFRLILSNLLSNAVKYSDAGSTVRVELERRSGVLRLTVADEGIGIPEDQQDRLFEPFYRAENVGAIRGTGLGLSILNEAVTLHGGTVAVESTCGTGTTFVVQLPLHPPEAAPSA